MKEKISALMDGELERHESGGTLDALRAGAEAGAAWRSYHLIGDVMRAAGPLSAGFAARVTARLANEPTVLAPRRTQPRFGWARWYALPAAASLAAVALVGWLAFAPQPGSGPAPTIAQQPHPSAPSMEAAQVLPPDAANDYLLAHQGYSPRNSLQGMAPYVRMVSGEASPGR